MDAKKIEISEKKLGRITGAFYLLIIVAGLVGSLFLRGNIIDPNDTLNTLNNLISLESTYRLGFLSDLFMVICDVLVSVLFYLLLKRVNHTLALFAMVFRLIQSAVLGANLSNLYEPLLLIQGGDGSSADLARDVMLAIQSFDYGYLISGVFFAINCLLMGYLIYHSGFIPRLLGVMIGIASVGYLTNCLAYFILPNFIEASQMLMFFTAVIAELSLCLYLLIKGAGGNSRVLVS